MALDLAGLKQRIRAAFDAGRAYQDSDDTESAADAVADAIAEAVDTFVRSGTVNVTVNPGTTANGVTVGAAAVPVTGTATGVVT